MERLEDFKIPVQVTWRWLFLGKVIGFCRGGWIRLLFASVLFLLGWELLETPGSMPIEPGKFILQSLITFTAVVCFSFAAKAAISAVQMKTLKSLPFYSAWIQVGHDGIILSANSGEVLSLGWKDILDTWQGGRGIAFLLPIKGYKFWFFIDRERVPAASISLALRLFKTAKEGRS